MAVASSGWLSRIETVRAWTPSEFKGIAEKAAKVASAYTPPGKMAEEWHGVVERRATFVPPFFSPVSEVICFAREEAVRRLCDTGFGLLGSQSWVSVLR